jgi:NADP-dependent 3-hydroxy acid dehydrogenase YdfG
MNLELTEKTALVSGSTAGIGFAVARELAAEGVMVIVNGRTAERVDQARQQIAADVPEAQTDGAVADLSAAAGAWAVTDRFASVDILVNNLGGFDAKPFADIEDSVSDIKRRDRTHSLRMIHDQ